MRAIISCRQHFDNLFRSQDSKKTGKQFINLKATKQALIAPVAEALKGAPFPEYETVIEVITEDRDIRVTYVMPADSTVTDFARVERNLIYIRNWAWDDHRCAVTL
jgi:hypothetical protein